jgi:hypothetical protein
MNLYEIAKIMKDVLQKTLTSETIARIMTPYQWLEVSAYDETHMGRVVGSVDLGGGVAVRCMGGGGPAYAV